MSHATRTLTAVELTPDDIKYLKEKYKLSFRLGNMPPEVGYQYFEYGNSTFMRIKNGGSGKVLREAAAIHCNYIAIIDKEKKKGALIHTNVEYAEYAEEALISAGVALEVDFRNADYVRKNLRVFIARPPSSEGDQRGERIESAFALASEKLGLPYLGADVNKTWSLVDVNLFIDEGLLFAFSNGNNKTICRAIKLPQEEIESQSLALPTGGEDSAEGGGHPRGKKRPGRGKAQLLTAPALETFNKDGFDVADSLLPEREAIETLRREGIYAFGRDPDAGEASGKEEIPLVKSWEQGVGLLKDAPIVKYDEAVGEVDSYQFRAVRKQGFEAVINTGEIISNVPSKATHWDLPMTAIGISLQIGEKPESISERAAAMFQITQKTAQKYGISRWGGDTTQAVLLKEVDKAWLVRLDDVDQFNRGEARMVQVRLPGMSIPRGPIAGDIDPTGSVGAARLADEAQDWDTGLNLPQLEADTRAAARESGARAFMRDDGIKGKSVSGKKTEPAKREKVEHRRLRLVTTLPKTPPQGDKWTISGLAERLGEDWRTVYHDLKALELLDSNRLYVYVSGREPIIKSLRSITSWGEPIVGDVEELPLERVVESEDIEGALNSDELRFFKTDLQADEEETIEEAAKRHGISVDELIERRTRILEKIERVRGDEPGIPHEGSGGQRGGRPGAPMRALPRRAILKGATLQDDIQQELLSSI